MQRPDLRERIATLRAQRERAGRRRRQRAVTRRDGARLELDGRWLTGFCSNDYLGLSQHFSVVGALQDAAGQHGAGGIASHLVCGHHAAHEALEREMADWLQVPRALLMGSGFLANLAVLQSLLREEDACVQDRLNHASLLDAARLAGCRSRRYPHADAEGAVRQLRGLPTGAAILATDGVFSMDGDIAPLRELALVARVQKAMLYVDDAHGIGVTGPDGRGSVAACRLDVSHVPLQLATLGKALGGDGPAAQPHWRNAGGAGGRSAGRRATGAGRALAARETAAPGRAAAQARASGRLRAAAFGHADPATDGRRGPRGAGDGGRAGS